MSILSAINRLAGSYRDMRRLSRTERMISALPAEVRKDIGWPDIRAARGDRHPRARGRTES